MAHRSAACGHEENREKVCAICIMKAKYKITAGVLERIKKYHIENYDLSDSCLPSGICSTCRALLSDIDSGKKSVDCLPDVFDYSVIVPEYRRATRADQNPNCNCKICNVGRQFHNNMDVRPKGRPSSRQEAEGCYDGKNNIPKISILCTKCLSPYGRGIRHNCSISSTRKTLSALMNNVDFGTQEIIASNVIRRKNSDIKPEELELRTPGRPMHVTIGRGRGITQFTSADMNQLQISTNLSNTSMRRIIIPFLRSKSGRRSIESGSAKSLQERDSNLGDLFSVQSVVFETGPANSHSECTLPIIVYCNDVERLVEKITSCREYDDCSEIVRFKYGLDGGGEFFKVCLSVFPESEIEGTFKGKLIDKHRAATGVKKLIILALVPKLQETYSNVKTVLDFLEIDQLDDEYTYAVDMKLANICGGLQAHGASYPCLYCECPKSEFDGIDSSKYQIIV